MRQFCIDAIAELKACPLDRWAVTYIRLRYHEFWPRYASGLIFSTTHGADFFQNLLDCLNGKEWTKKDEAGEYGDNFRKLIKFGC